MSGSSGKGKKSTVDFISPGRLGPEEDFWMSMRREPFGGSDQNIWTSEADIPVQGIHTNDITMCPDTAYSYKKSVTMYDYPCARHGRVRDKVVQSVSNFLDGVKHIDKASFVNMQGPGFDDAYGGVI